MENQPVGHTAVPLAVNTPAYTLNGAMKQTTVHRCVVCAISITAFEGTTCNAKSNAARLLCH